MGVALKYMLPLFKASDRINYSCEMFCVLAQHKFILSPRLSHQLQWSRFINTHGKQGKNIPCDLHMEHLYRIVKTGVRGLGANKAENAMIRIGKCVDSVAQVLATYDEEHGVKKVLGHHTIASAEKDLDLLLKNELSTQNTFTQVSGRRHAHILIPKTTLLQSVNEDKFSVWLSEKWCALLAGLSYMIGKPKYRIYTCTEHLSHLHVIAHISQQLQPILALECLYISKSLKSMSLLQTVDCSA